MNLKLGNFNWIKMDSRDQNLDLIKEKCNFISVLLVKIKKLIYPPIKALV